MSKGPLSKLFGSYMRMVLPSSPTAKTTPCGSNATHGVPWIFMRPWHVGDRISHNRTESSMAADMKVSFTGFTSRDVTLQNSE